MILSLHFILSPTVYINTLLLSLHFTFPTLWPHFFVAKYHLFLNITYCLICTFKQWMGGILQTHNNILLGFERHKTEHMLLNTLSAKWTLPNANASFVWLSPNRGFFLLFFCISIADYIVLRIEIILSFKLLNTKFSSINDEPPRQKFKVQYYAK